MEITLGTTLRILAIVNAVPLAALLWMMLAPFVMQTTFAVVIGDMRYGYGSGGWIIQNTKTFQVIRQGWFPWH